MVARGGGGGEEGSKWGGVVGIISVGMHQHPTLFLHCNSIEHDQAPMTTWWAHVNPIPPPSLKQVSCKFHVCHYPLHVHQYNMISGHDYALLVCRD